MEMGGYAGNILYVDLAGGESRKEPLNMGIAWDFIGGWGINAKLAYDLIKPGVDPFSPECPLIWGAGLLNGTGCPSTPKSFFTTKCPASGTVSTAVGSLYFGSKLKWAGYDHLIITGKAEKPSYLKIMGDEVEICDAEGIWGKDLFEATDELKKRHGETCSVACIGPAGENLVKISTVLLDKGTTCGRSFAGNMGSKNLKAIVLDGTKGIKVADEGRFMKLVNGLIERAMRDPNRDNWRNLGLYFIWGLWNKAGYFAVKDRSETFPQKEAEEFYGVETYKK